MNGINIEPNTVVTQEDEEEEEGMKESLFMDVLEQLENYTPTIPDAVTDHFLKKSGVNTDDMRIVRLISLAAQKYMADIINDSFQLNKMKVTGQGTKSGKTKEKKSVLTMDDLMPVLTERGIKAKKPAYYI